MNLFSIYTPAAGPWISATEPPKDNQNYLLLDNYGMNYIGFYNNGNWCCSTEGLEFKGICLYAKIFNT